MVDDEGGRSTQFDPPADDDEVRAVVARMLDWVMRRTEVLGATGATLLVVDAGGATAAVVGVGSSAHIPATIGSFTVTRRAPLFVAADTGEAVWVPSRLAGMLRFPEYVDQLMPGQSFAALPLVWRGGRLGGVIVHFADARSFPDLERAHLGLVADVVAESVGEALEEVAARAADVAAGPAAAVTAAGSAAGVEPVHSDVALLDGMLDPVLICEAAGHHIVYANQAACELTGYAEHELVGMTMSSLSPTVATMTTPDAREQGVASGAVRRRDGSVCQVEFHVSAEDRLGRRVIVVLDRSQSIRESDERAAAAGRAAMAASEKAARQVNDRALQAVFATSMSLSSLAVAVPDELRSRVEALMDELEDVVDVLRGH